MGRVHRTEQKDGRPICIACKLVSATQEALDVHVLLQSYSMNESVTKQYSSHR